MERELGRGGMAVVYLAEDLRHGRKVALKVLRPEFAGVLAVERFLREIRIAGVLDHSRIVPLLDSGEADGLPWYVMRYADGASLRERLAREKQLPIPDALRIAREVADALTHAHARDILHRDIKPDNILFEAGHAALSDFGIARAIANATPEDRLTESGITVGTPSYMSPEQASGETQIDARSDVYSLACVVYEMLAGEPPFTGPNASAVRARHQLDPVPSLRTVRGTVPHPLEQVIVRALAKVPADRYATAQEFAQALENPPAIAAVPRTRRARAYAWVAAALFVVGAFSARQLFWPAHAALEPDKVLIYPLVERGLTPGDSGAGYDVALMLGAALEHTEPLKWLDGWQYLDSRGRADASLVTPRTARRIAEDRRAGYYVDGVVRQNADSVAVTLRLHDVLGDSVITQETEAGAIGRSPAYQLGLTAAARLLPRLLATDRRIDFAPLTDRRPAAIALWLQGEREYRLARFAPALRLYERSVAEDSALAFAAVKGAQAANWLQYLRQSRQLLGVALAGEARLPPRYRDFAHGLDAYFGGRADSAVFYLERALAAAPAWEEAAMALGDVYYHLLPSRTPHDSLARAAFELAADADTLFTPALLHLVEIAARDGDVRRARRLMQRLRSGQPDTSLLRQVQLMTSCVDQGAARFNWVANGGGNAVATLFAAKGLAVAVAQPECAEAGFRAVLGMPGSAAGQRWSALLGLQGLLAARGRISELTALLDSAAASGTSQAIWLYVLDAEAGLAVHRQSAQFETMARQRFGDKVEGAPPYVLWMLALHYARVGNLPQVQALHAALARRVAEPGARATRLLADAVAADLAVAQRDTAAAIAKLRVLAVSGTVDTLTWSLWEPLAVERLKLARLLMGRGQFAEAVVVASAFDHTQPIVFLPFVPASLEIRLAASRALGDAARAAIYKQRLERLGRRDLIAAQ